MLHVIPRHGPETAPQTEEELAREIAMIVWLEGVPLEHAAQLAGMPRVEFERWLAWRLSDVRHKQSFSNESR